MPRTIPPQAAVGARRIFRPTGLALAISVAIGSTAAVSGEDVDLAVLGDLGFVISGAAEAQRLGLRVSGAGDVNGDGYADLIVTANRGSTIDDELPVTYLIFGKPDTDPITTADIASSGFSMTGRTSDDFPTGVSGAGDVNGDGLVDLIVGTRDASPEGRDGAGAAYVVFGKRGNASISLDSLGDGGFPIIGAMPGDRTGAAVSGAGDVNGDGLADVVVSTYPAFIDGERGIGASYVVFGKSSSDAIDLAALGPSGFRMSTGLSDDRSAYSSGAGDVNGDGLADVIIGASYADPDGVIRAGQSYVVFGSGASSDVDLLSLGDRGFVITGASAANASGGSVAGAGDVNGDGLADVVVGARLANPNGTATGAAYVVFGKRDTGPVDLGALGDFGFVLAGANEGDGAGWSVAGAGDVTGDGSSDVLVGAPTADGNGLDAGEAYLVVGRPDPFDVDLGALGLDGSTLTGGSAGDRAGRALSAAGDVNGDGMADFIVTANSADPNGVEDAGAGYVIFSRSTPLSQVEYRGYARNDNAPRLALGTIGDGSDDSTPGSRLWADFDDGATLGEDASLLQVMLIRNAGSFDDAVAPVSWQVETDRDGWTQVGLSFRYLESEILGVDEADLRIFHSAGDAGEFAPVSTSVDSSQNILSVTTGQLGTFAIGALAPDDAIFRDGFDGP